MIRYMEFIDHTKCNSPYAKNFTLLKLSSRMKLIHQILMVMWMNIDFKGWLFSSMNSLHFIHIVKFCHFVNIINFIHVVHS